MTKTKPDARRNDLQRVWLSSLLLLSACGASGRGDEDARDHDGASGDVSDDVSATEQVVFDIGADDLEGRTRKAAVLLDLDTTIGRFLDDDGALPLDRVVVFAEGHEREALLDVVERCAVSAGYDVTGPDEFVVGQGEAFVGRAGGNCMQCGFTMVCPGRCEELGPGEALPPIASSDGATDPPDDDVTPAGGTSSGGSAGDTDAGNDTSGGAADDGGSGASSGGMGGSHGGVGNPGG